MNRTLLSRTGLLAAVLVALSAGPGRAADDRIVSEAVVAAPLVDVWSAFTTKAGMESWMVAHAEMDLRVGGAMRTHYDPKGQLGDAKSIVNTVLAYDPGRMLAIKVAKHPDTFPFPNAVKSMWTVIYFEPAGAQQTKVTVVGLGFTADEESRKMRTFFQQGNDYTVKKLQEKFAKPAGK